MKRLIALCLGLFCMVSAHAHKPSDSYLTLSVQEKTVEGRWDIALRDLDFSIGLDANGDGAITWGEVRARQAEIDAYAMSHLKISGAGGACPATVREHLIDDHSDGAYVVLRFAAQCASAPTTLDVAYSLLFDVDPQHKGLLRLQYQGSSSTAIFSPQTSKQQFKLAGTSKLTQFLDYGHEGVWHIWIGYDHILFLLALLLPAVVVREHKTWQGVAAFRPAFWSVLKVVTAFTVAHSITLSLATLGVLDLPSRLVESTIAASVLIAALNNVYPLFRERRWMMAFVFGLIHGFGFASVLSDLGLPKDTLVLALVGFNLGVEAGQLAIVAVFLPLAYMLRQHWIYRRAVLTGGSIIIAILAAVWFAERAFDMKLITG